MDGEESTKIEAVAEPTNGEHSKAGATSKKQREEREIGVVTLFVAVVIVIILIFAL